MFETRSTTNAASVGPSLEYEVTVPGGFGNQFDVFGFTYLKHMSATDSLNASSSDRK